MMIEMTLKAESPLDLELGARDAGVMAGRRAWLGGGLCRGSGRCGSGWGVRRSGEGRVAWWLRWVFS